MASEEGLKTNSRHKPIPSSTILAHAPESAFLASLPESGARCTFLGLSISIEEEPRLTFFTGCAVICASWASWEHSIAISALVTSLFVVHSFATIGANNMSTLLSRQFSIIPDFNGQRVSGPISLSALFATWNQILTPQALVPFQGVDIVIALAAELSIGVPPIFLSAHWAFAVV